MAEKIPFVQVDASSAPAIDGVTDAEALTGTEVGLLVLGKGGTDTAQVLKTAADGAVAVTDNSGSLTVDDGGGSLTVDGSVAVSNFPATQPVSGTVAVSNFPATQPVSAASLPLPAGAATAAKQPALGTAGTPSADVVTVQGAVSMTALRVDGSAVTQPVSAASLPLPAGAATAAKQPALGTAGTPSADVVTVQGAVSMTALRVDGSAVTQPVSGTVAVSNLPATQPVSAVALPLPTGASTSALQTTGNTSLGNIDTKTPALVSGRVPVDGSAVTQPVSDGGGSLTVDGSVAVSNFPGTQAVSGSVSVSNFPATQPVSAASLPLPTGAATETTANTILKETTFTGRINTQGQKTSALSTPVVIASDQSSLAVVAPADTTTNGTITATGQSVSASISGKQNCVVEIGDFFTGTLHFQASLDGSNYYSIIGTAIEATSTGSTTFSNGIWRFACGGLPMFRVIAIGGFTGSATVVIRASTVASAWAPPIRTPTSVAFTDPALVVISAAPPSANLSNVATSTASAQILSAGTRRGATIVNDATAILYLKFGITASSTSYTVALAPAVGGVPSYYEVHKDYSGRIDGVLASGTGTARVTTIG